MYVAFRASLYKPKSQLLLLTVHIKLHVVFSCWFSVRPNLSPFVKGPNTMQRGFETRFVRSCLPGVATGIFRFTFHRKMVSAHKSRSVDSYFSTPAVSSPTETTITNVCHQTSRALN